MRFSWPHWNKDGKIPESLRLHSIMLCAQIQTESETLQHAELSDHCEQKTIKAGLKCAWGTLQVRGSNANQFLRQSSVLWCGSRGGTGVSETKNLQAYSTLTCTSVVNNVTLPTYDRTSSRQSQPVRCAKFYAPLKLTLGVFSFPPPIFFFFFFFLRKVRWPIWVPLCIGSWQLRLKIFGAWPSKMNNIFPSPTEVNKCTLFSEGLILFSLQTATPQWFKENSVLADGRRQGDVNLDQVALQTTGISDDWCVGGGLAQRRRHTHDSTVIATIHWRSARKSPNSIDRHYARFYTSATRNAITISRHKPVPSQLDQCGLTTTTMVMIPPWLRKDPRGLSRTHDCDCIPQGLPRVYLWSP